MWVKILLLFFVFSFLFRTDLSFDQDLGRHIKLGEIITQTLQVPKTNLFSYTNPDFPFINTHWLFEIIAYFFVQTKALQLFLILKIIIFLLSVWLVIKNSNSILLLPVGFIFMHVLRERLELRPEIFSFLFTALTLYILEKNNKKLLLLLPLIQLIWINTHIYFFVGLLTQAIFLVYSLGSKLFNTGGWIRSNLGILTVVFFLSVLICLINPNGFAGLTYPLNVTKNYGYTIVENQTMFLLQSINFRDPNFLFVKLSWGIIGLSLLIAMLRRNFEIKNILLATSGMILALMNVRSFPYLVFLSLPATLANFGAIRLNAFTKTLILIFAGLLILESYLYLNGDYYRYTDGPHQVNLGFVESGKVALDFVLKNDLPGPIYNNFDIGSYIIYRGYPNYRVFIDGRPEAYPKEFFQQIYIPSQSDYDKFKELDSKLGFKTVIFSHTDQTPWGKAFLQNVLKDSNWKLVYIDDFMLVLVKEEVANEKKLNVIDLSKLSPQNYNFSNHRSYLNLAVFLFSTQNIEAAKQFTLAAKQLFPESPAINQIMGNPTSNYFFW